jgi:transposase-like protein
VRAADFQKLLGELSKLDAGQRKAAIRVLSGVDEGRQAIEIVEAGRSSGPGCPHCGHEHAQPWGQSNDLHRWRCKECRRSFNALTGTPLAGLRKQEQWLEHGRALVDGVSLRKVAARCDVALSTAFRWRHRHLAAPKAVQPAALQVSPSTVSKASAPEMRSFSRLDSLAYALPCQRFADVLTGTCA